MAYAVAIDHHDRIVVAGSTLAAHPDIALARFTPSGRLDPTFGQGGKVVTDLGANDYAFDVAIQDDGGIVVVGERRAAASDRFVVQRYRPNGTLDAGFANAGTALTGLRTAVPGRDGRGDRTRRTHRGRRLDVERHHESLRVARYLMDGRLDRSFGDDGRLTIDVSPSAEQFTDVAIQPDGRIVAVGWAEVSLVPVFSAVRFDHRRPARSGVRRRRHRPRGRRRREPTERAPWRSRRTASSSSSAASPPADAMSGG